MLFIGSLSQTCVDHRLHHGCHFGSASDVPASDCDAKPLRPYLCSLEGCFVSESIRIDCQYCGFNFCLKHRYPEEHRCCSQNISINKDEDEVRRETKEKVERMVAETVGIIDGGMSAVSVPTKNKVLSKEEKKRADRIAVMRLKSSSRNCSISAAEQLFLFVVRDDGRRDLVMVSKRWTIGRCVDHIANQLAVPNSNAVFGAKMLRLFGDETQSEPLPMADNVEMHLKDLASVLLRRDE